MSQQPEVNFFFQAEDGIRDIGVTGVQTCALPIFPYIGELVSATPMHDAGGLVDLRAWVADTVALRRRKGTLAAVEAVARAEIGRATCRERVKISVVVV